ncbi:MAG: hypothetical protein KME64_39830 [Scytonematopsis contorta HA4267-MV1]|jgi:Gpi18-like mannosyltransferase|nr:hypothetical protein [Scytonematopsis contorta HA4267-MV1]
MAQVQILIKRIVWTSDLLFPASMWFGSRIIILIAMLIVAPELSAPPDGIAPKFGLGVFDAWDSRWYYEIVNLGYKFVDDGSQQNLAFFPMFPMCIRLLMYLGLPYQVAGTLINNLAFLGALYFLYLWTKGQYGSDTARWVTAVLAWCPLSLFGTVIYTEGLYLFFSIGTLRAFDQKKYGWTAFWGAMATATRPTGLALIPALLIAAWKERKPAIAYIAALATGTGVALFSIYCAVNFGNPLAFISAQRGWRPSLGFDGQGWWDMLAQVVVGTTNWQQGYITNPLHPLLFSIVLISAYSLWLLGKNWSGSKIIYLFYAFVTTLLIVATDNIITNLLNVLMFLGGAYILWSLRKQLTPVTVIYGFCGFGLLLASGGTISLSRLAYGIVPLILSVGVLLSRNPRQGYCILGIFVVLLARLSIKFAQQLWIG